MRLKKKKKKKKKKRSLSRGGCLAVIGRALALGLRRVRRALRSSFFPFVLQKFFHFGGTVLCQPEGAFIRVGSVASITVDATLNIA